MNYKKSEYYENRELSWIKFNGRVLEEARNKENLLFERMKFLSISASNLDEFFIVRVASLRDQLNAGHTKPDISGMKPSEQLDEIRNRTREFMEEQYSIYNRSLLPALKKAGLTLVKRHENLTQEEGAFADRYFQEEIYPVLTPMAVDSSRPFPLLRNKSLNIGAFLSKKGSKKHVDFATVQVPSDLDRLVRLPVKDGEKTRVILLEEVIERNIQKLFLNYEVLCAHPYRIMRNAGLTIDEEEAADLLQEIQKQLKKRQWGEVIRLEVEEGIDKKLLAYLERELIVKEGDVFCINGPLDLTFLMKAYDLEGFEDYKAPKYIPQPVPGMRDDLDIFSQIRQGDILLHHPYQTFDPVVDFIRQASRDANVLAIKQTLYRVSGNSPITAALAQAADNGKQVTVLIELKARFDEEHNIVWAKMLEQAGCHVIYGLVGLKTHSKITLVVRREEDGIRRYVHLGTGNYNDATAKLYTDMGLLTCSDTIGEDATAVFNMLSGYSEPLSWNKLLLAPHWLRDGFLHLIQRETENALEGRKARIIAQMNSLCDRGIIEALYKASAAGVQIDLIVRGICCLKTGIPGISDNISVRSIVGMFLEHGRIFYFHNGGREEVYMGSADWMPRNLDKRVEILFPLEKEELKREVIHILHILLDDTQKARILQPNGTYVLSKSRRHKLNSQEFFCEEAKKRAKTADKNEQERIFIPEKRPED
ncbi:MAG: RNA degradosome polyphosphate kinase [Lachnospiraceae bacterium]|nr:RNA degradosome polyphosphate kinase [Lachnospiraceae bacterium]